MHGRGADVLAAFTDVFATFHKEGGRIGSGSLGSGQGGVGRCACCGAPRR
ncbi:MULTISPECIES: hypothetical protein [Streptomyces]